MLLSFIGWQVNHLADFSAHLIWMIRVKWDIVMVLGRLGSPLDFSNPWSIRLAEVKRYCVLTVVR